MDDSSTPPVQAAILTGASHLETSNLGMKLHRVRVERGT